MDWNFIIFSAVKIAVVIGAVLTVVAYSVLAERKIAAWIQDRVGPNRCAPPFVKYIPVIGPFLTRIGFFQPMADALKSILKEDFMPAGVRKVYFWLAPAVAVIPALLTLAVIPFGSQLGAQKMVIADLNVGILYTFGIVSLSVYGIVLAGYSANSKYPMFGGIRSSAQMISYEISMGMSVIPVLLIVGNLNLGQIINWQSTHGWLVLYHGVENTNPATRRVVYRLGAMLLDLKDPTKVLARARNFIMEPEAYYEKFGLFIPNVIFPTGCVVKDGLLWIYYGCCDISIGLATVPLEQLVNHIFATS